MRTFAAKLKQEGGLSAPDVYDSERGRPDDNFVVSRNRDGSALSRYSDLEWDRTPYDPEGRTYNIIFQFWDNASGCTERRKQLLGEVRWLMFTLLYLRPGPGISNHTCATYLSLLRSLARFCDINGMRIQDVLSQSEVAFKFADGATVLKELVSLLRLLRKLGPELVGFGVIDIDSLKQLRESSRKYRENLKQHPPIPTRIYSHILSWVTNKLDKFEKVLEPISRLAEECFSDPFVGVGYTRQKKIRKEIGNNNDGRYPGFPELLAKHGLRELWGNWGYRMDRRGMVRLLSEIQMLSSLQIMAFSGMRGSEVNSLPYSCLQEVSYDGVVHYILQGRVTKLTKGKVKRAQWVTSERGRDAVRIAQKISEVIYKAKGKAPSTEVQSINEFYLLISPHFLRAEKKGGKHLPSQLKLGVSFSDLRKKFCPQIEEDDLKELELIDPHRSWRQDANFRVGAMWLLTGHQLRRSLALYAQRSGLVSLPSLKRQLQHLTLEMAKYYARGSAFANDFIGTEHKDKHFGEEWQEANPMSQYLAYVSHVLLGDSSQLFGGHAQWIKVRFHANKQTVLDNRHATLTRFQKGEMAYKPTPVGGCVNPLPCDKNPVDVLHTECIVENCRHLAGNLRKTEHVILVKQRELASLKKLNPGLAETRHAEAELAKLVAAYRKAEVSIKENARNDDH